MRFSVQILADWNGQWTQVGQFEDVVIARRWAERFKGSIILDRESGELEIS